MKYYIFLAIHFLFFVGSLSAQQNYSKHVDPMIGTGGHGHTFPGATVPFGMVQLSPDTRIDGSWDGCSGYHYSDSVIYGFSHTHLSGTGCSDFGDIMLMPMMGPSSYDRTKYASKFSHKNEKSSAGFYAVKLEDDSIDVELTANTRVGIHKYTFNKDGEVNIILDLEHRDKLLDGQIVVSNSRTLNVYRKSEAWAKEQILFARIEFSKDFIENTPLRKEMKGSAGTYYSSCQSFGFKIKKDEVIMVKVSLSPVSYEGAEKNMKAELPDWDFEKIKKAAAAAWDIALSKIEVQSNDSEKLKIFYTSLYHTMIQPNVAMDVDGMYRGRDGETHKANGFTYYSVFSLWDTFRAAHPLYTIIDQKRTADFINTFLAQYDQGGRLPVWELASNETDCMIGYHAVSVIADAMLKGIKGFDYEQAFEASKHSAMLDHLGLKAYKQNGFIAMDDEHESVSKTLEYAYDDWCIAQMASILNRPTDYTYFMKRSQSWKNVFDKEKGFMRPKKNGGWLTPFEPREVNNNFTEGNSWQYTFFVPQDIYGLINAMGGEQKFENKLDELFTTSNQTTGREQVDITGLIGQYAHGNEPSHHMAYLYNFVSRPSKTQSRIHQILTEFYKPLPDGLIGNEDCGQMSAWYVLSALGIYQVTPGAGSFMIGTPGFSSAKVHLENGKIFTISSKNNSIDNYYVKSTTLNDHEYPEDFIAYTDIMEGSNLFFEMSSTAKDDFKYSLPPQKSTAERILPVPSIAVKSRVFDDNTLVEINSSANTYYALSPMENAPMSYQLYEKPFVINDSRTIYAYSDNGSKKSDTISGSFFKRPNHWKIDIHSKYNSQYTAGGDEGLIDGLHGDLNWRKGEWQGYQSQDFEAVIDLGQNKKLSTFEVGFLQDSRSWILMPVKVEFYASSDNKTFVLIGSETHTISPKEDLTQIKQFVLSNQQVKARFIKVKAYNFGKLPEWHMGAGGDAFIFVDEITIK